MKYLHIDIDDALNFEELGKYGKLFEIARTKVQHQEELPQTYSGIDPKIRSESFNLPDPFYIHRRRLYSHRSVCVQIPTV